jgi:hypothetical protein
MNEKNRWSLRLEDFIDQSGFKTAIGTSLSNCPLCTASLNTSAAGQYIQVSSITLTYGYLVDPSLEIRAEARMDRANLPGTITKNLFITNSTGTLSSNTASSASIEAVYKF